MSAMAEAPVVVWPRRVSRRVIRQLYELDAKGIVEAELIDEVGFGLLARCKEHRQRHVRPPPRTGDLPGMWGRCCPAPAGPHPNAAAALRFVWLGHHLGRLLRLVSPARRWQAHGRQ